MRYHGDYGPRNYHTDFEPNAKPDVHTTQAYEVDAFHVLFKRTRDAEITEFLSVREIAGTEHVVLKVGPLFRILPGGTVYLPAGEIEWRCMPATSSLLISFRLGSLDHPAFDEHQWVKAQQDCAYRVHRENPAR